MSWYLACQSVVKSETSLAGIKEYVKNRSSTSSYCLLFNTLSRLTFYADSVNLLFTESLFVSLMIQIRKGSCHQGKNLL